MFECLQLYIVYINEFVNEHVLIVHIFRLVSVRYGKGNLKKQLLLVDEYCRKAKQHYQKFRTSISPFNYTCRFNEQTSGSQQTHHITCSKRSSVLVKHINNDLIKIRKKESSVLQVLTIRTCSRTLTCSTALYLSLYHQTITRSMSPDHTWFSQFSYINQYVLSVRYLWFVIYCVA